MNWPFVALPVLHTLVQDFYRLIQAHSRHQYLLEAYNTYLQRWCTLIQKFLEVKDHKNKPAKVKFTSRLDYVPFRLKDDAAVVKRAVAAAKGIKLKPTTKVTNGGLDANWMVKHGIPTVTFGAGLTIETKSDTPTLAQLRSWATAWRWSLSAVWAMVVAWLVWLL